MCRLGSCSISEGENMTAKPKTKEHAAIDPEMVKHVAYLVRLGITEEEAQAFSQQFTAIIDYFQRLNEVDTSQTPPATQLTAARSVMRADETRPSLDREEFLRNVPHRQGGYVRVPMVLGEE
jgi:aspartyl-tRNA(Asn)/glutamyl-tRNA(Gln) amidotransferase subunit C